MKNIILFCLLFNVAYSEDVNRMFIFNYIVNIESSNGKKIELWVPIPQSNEVQTITNVQVNSDGLDYSIEDEKVHRNRYLYINHLEGTSNDKTLILSFEVNRIEHQNIKYKNVDPQNYLGSYSVVPTGDFFLEIIEKNNLSKENIRGIYNYVLSGMHYGKPKEVGDKYYSDPWLSSGGKYGSKAVSRDEVVSLYKRAKSENSIYTFGNGNSIYACDIGVGNCTDYHSYFMSLSRTLEVPARFHMGFSIPDKSEGIVGGYHCWADYYVEGQGWTPVDISEADKAPENTDYFFGNVTENRVEMMVGRDFELKGYDQGVINLFIYPLLEIEDKLSKSFSKSFSYKNL